MLTHRKYAIAGVAAVAAIAVAAQAQQPAATPAPAASAVANHDNADGAVLFERYCSGCHAAGPGHPGTMMLEIKGIEHPALVGRPDLEPDLIRAVVRNGLIEMPPFRPTELTDAELEKVIAYIKKDEKKVATKAGKKAARR